MTNQEAVQLQTQEKLELTAEEQIAALSKVIPFALTPRDQAYFDWLTLHRELTIGGRVSTHLGPELTRASQTFFRLKSREKGGLKKLPMPVIYVSAELPGNPRSLYGNILKALDRHPLCGNLADFRTRTWTTLRHYGVELLIVDHTNVLNVKALHELGRMFQDLGIPIILLGNSDLRQALRHSPYGQVDILFAEEHTFRPLDLSEWCSVIEHWEINILTWRSSFLVAHQPKICKALFVLSGNSVDVLYGKLKKLAAFCIRHQTEALEPADLEAILQG